MRARDPSRPTRPISPRSLRPIVVDEAVTQERFAVAVGSSRENISRLAKMGVLEDGATAVVWLRAYCARLREQAAGRMGGSVEAAEQGAAAGDGKVLDLVQERARLTRSQREAVEIKNAIARGEYAPIERLARTLATASQSVAERFEQLPRLLRTIAPDMPESQRDRIMTAIADARNAWVQETAALVAESLEEPAEAEEAAESDPE